MGLYKNFVSQTRKPEGFLGKIYPNSKVTAIDYSDVSVRKATKYNAEAIKSGRCKVQQGDVSALALVKYL